MNHSPTTLLEQQLERLVTGAEPDTRLMKQLATEVGAAVASCDRARIHRHRVAFVWAMSRTLTGSTKHHYFPLGMLTALVDVLTVAFGAVTEPVSSHPDPTGMTELVEEAAHLDVSSAYIRSQIP